MLKKQTNISFQPFSLSPGPYLTLFSPSLNFHFLFPSVLTFYLETPPPFSSFLSVSLLEPSYSASLPLSLPAPLHSLLPPFLSRRPLTPLSPSRFSPGRLVIDTYKLPGGSGIVCDPSLSSPARRRFVI